jgi:cellulose synthase/poly-beta-1,6-N-acetylglucosamine synthase-like glycosyltransferase
VIRSFQSPAEAGGFKDGMKLGEDVDFCWRMRKLGYSLLYIPQGKVAHKHRNQLFKMIQRRGAYGTSEAVLYRTHRDKKKSFLIPLWAGLSFLATALAILLLNLYPLAAIPVFFGIDLISKSHLQGRTWHGTLRSYLSFYYFISFHLVRYYLILLVSLGVLFHPLWFLCAFMLLLTSIVDYAVKKPRLFYPVYLFFYSLEHLAYQIGVFWGCLKLVYFGSYLPAFTRKPEQPSW